MKDNIFKKVMMSKVDTNRFDLSHDVKISFKMGQLIPTCCMEVIPGDRVKLGVENMLRFAPLISPVMHKVNVTTHYFFVPNRLLWSNWEKFITGSEPVEAPYILTDEFLQGTISDYLGVPVVSGTPNPVMVSPMQAAAYLKIYDEYYRDQNLQTEKFVPLVDGDNSNEYLTLMNEFPQHRAWMHDYFTSCLPFAQKGDSVQLPLTIQNDIPVDYDANGQPGQFRDVNGNIITTPGSVTNATGPVPLASSMNVSGSPATYDPNGTLTVDVQSSATDINTLRRAFRLQEWLEKNARGGTRYVENILAHFGVKSSDARLQRPEYIGGSKQNMVISEVLSTAQNDTATVPVGQMAGHGISVGGGNTFGYRAEEHGFIIGIINVQPVTAYQDGLHKSFTRFDKLDYAWPTFANLGEQEVKNKEIFVNSAEGENVFGYIPRYSEYKFMNSRVAGEMRSSLSFWHLGRIFQNLPTLSDEFIKCVPDPRIFAVVDPEHDHIYAHIFNNISAVRKLPRYGIPTI